MKPITPWQVMSYLRCPFRSQFLTEPPRPADEAIFLRTIKQIYLYQMKHLSRAPWRKVSTWLDREVKLTSNLPDWEAATNLLARCFKWYNNYYLESPEQTLISVPIIVDLGVHATYRDTIDILEVTTDLAVVDAGTAPRIAGDNALALYRDPLVHLRMWGVERAFHLRPKRYRRHLLTQGAVQTVDIYARDSSLKSAEQMIYAAARGMTSGAFYPIPSGQCNNCDYYKQCKY